MSAYRDHEPAPPDCDAPADGWFAKQWARVQEIDWEFWVFPIAIVTVILVGAIVLFVSGARAQRECVADQPNRHARAITACEKACAELDADARPRIVSKCNVSLHWQRRECWCMTGENFIDVSEYVW